MSKPATEDRGPCRCSACGLSFASLFSFDCHRTGDYPDLRRCLPENQLKQTPGWSISNGRWRVPG
jgi:hypothetical protein